MANSRGGMQMGMQGAMMGAQVGGPWGALIGGGLGFLFGNSMPDNEKIMKQKFNDEVVRNTARSMFEMQREQTQENKRTSAALASYQSNRKVQASTMNANYGAADIIGSSAEALKQTLDWQTNEAMNQTVLNAITGAENFNTRLDQLTNQATNQLQRNREGSATINPAELVQTGMSLYSTFKSGGGLQGMVGAAKAYAPTSIKPTPSIWQANTTSSVIDLFNSAVQ